MKASFRSARSLVPALGLLGLLVLLAVLQFRWTGQLSRAEGARLRANLTRDVESFAREFDREITRVLAVFVFGRDAEEELADRFVEWTERAPYPEIVSDVLIVRVQDAAAAEILRVDPERRSVQSVEPDPELEPVMARIAEWRHEPGRERRGARPSLIVEDPPTLVVPQSVRGDRRPDFHGPHRRFLIVRLDRAAMIEQMLPDLIERYFAGDGASYEVTVSGPRGPVYSANVSTLSETVDVQSSIFGILPLREIRELMRNDAEEQRAAAPPSALGVRGNRDGVWTIQVTHPAGSLANAVAYQRTRNLAISFAILVLLGVSVGLALRSARRAQELARQKMEFVAGVSHELRTPLAVICSAGQNLADGVTGDLERTRRYGEVIRREGERLSDMVEQVLDHARVQSGRLESATETVDLHGVIDGALADCASLIDEHGVSVQRDVPPELPLVRGESRALRQALRNLIMNAIRHTDERWVRVEACAAGRRPGRAIRIAIEDRGHGIEPAERDRLFEPFYRGRAASRVHGSGLGLSLVRQIVSAHGGTVTIEDSASGGSRFVVQLPAAAQDSTAAAAGSHGEPETEPFGRA